MKKSKLLLLLFSALLFISCGDFLLNPDPEDTPEINFQILWEDFDNHYSRFKYKGVNWDSLYDVYHPKVIGDISGNRLFEILSSLLSNLKDSHVILKSDYGLFQFRRKKYHTYFSLDLIKKEYLTNMNRHGIFTYGMLTEKLGYIHIASFSRSNEEFEFIDNILALFENCEQIILDVRGNGGGNSGNAEIIAGRFADQKRLYAYYKYRNGRDHNDFTELKPSYITPEGNKNFRKPGVVITNRFSASATEDFIMMMRVFPYFTVVGDTTAGVLGGRPITRELPNGWLYRMATAREYSDKLESFEGVGIPPDIHVSMTESDSSNGVDTMLEYVVQLFQ